MKHLTGPLLVLSISVAVLLVALLTDIEPEWKLLALTLSAGFIIGVTIFYRTRSGQETPDSAADTMPAINIGRIQIRGGIGAGILIAILLGAVLIELPVLRWIALPGVLGGLLLGALLVLWRKHQDG